MWEYFSYLCEMKTIQEKLAALRKEADTRIIELINITGKKYLFFGNITLLSEHNDKFIEGVAIHPESGEVAMITSEGTFWQGFEVEDQNIFEVLEILEKGEYFHTTQESEDNGYDLADFEWVTEQFV